MSECERVGRRWECEGERGWEDGSVKVIEGGIDSG